MELNTSNMRVILCFIFLFLSTANTADDTSTEEINTSTISLTENAVIDDNHTTETTMYDWFNETSTIAPVNNGSGQKSVESTKSKAVDDLDFCTCDLQINFCDVNCCCDKDCSNLDKEVFETCEAEPIYYDTRYCNFIKYVYINNTRFQWHINQNGLFCVVKTNLPPSYTIQRKQLIRTFDESEFEKRNKFTWAGHDSDSSSFSINSNEKLVFGTSMWKVNKNGLQRFEIPNSFITNSCIIKENVRYLKNIHTTCSQSDLSESNPQLHLKNYVENIKIIGNVNLFNITKYKSKLFEDCPRNICQSITPKLCDESFHNCIDILKNNSRLSVRCSISIKNKINTCVNVVKKIKYNIYHNGTKGVTNIYLLAILEEVSYEFGQDVPEWNQEFFVHFFWRNTTLKKSQSLSGNPGYLIGSPIVKGSLITLHNESDTILKINRSSSVFKELFLVFPKNVLSECILTSSDYLTVEFGYNLLTQCIFRKTVYNNKKTVNGTEICKEIQKSIMRIWNIDNKVMIGSFGNANFKNLDEWQKILFKKKPEAVLNITSGIYFSKNNSIFCANILRSLQIDIFHSRIDLDALVNQEKILGVAYTLNYGLNISLPFTKTTKQINFESELETRVNFYDITAKKEKKVVDPPSLEIKLPYDFFYPFIRINNSSCKISINIVMCVIFLIVTVFFK